MHTIAMSPHAGIRLAEVGFLLVLFAGLWFAASAISFFGHARFRTAVGGLALAAAGLLLIVAAHWGHFG
jgi:hypothetical protein